MNFPPGLGFREREPTWITWETDGTVYGLVAIVRNPSARAEPVRRRFPECWISVLRISRGNITGNNICRDVSYWPKTALSIGRRMWQRDDVYRLREYVVAERATESRYYQDVDTECSWNVRGLIWKYSHLSLNSETWIHIRSCTWVWILIWNFKKFFYFYF